MIEIQTFVCNSFWENTYLVYDTETKEAVLIDPGCSNEAEWIPIKTTIVRLGLQMKHLLLTHGHVDHILGTEWPVKEYDMAVCGSVDEMKRLPSAEIQAQLFGLRLQSRPVAVTGDLKEGDRLTLGNFRLEIIDVPGHSPHGLCYYLPEAGILFSGDVLFAGGIGRSDFGTAFGCDGRALVEGIIGKLLTLPSATQVFPGHGASTTIGAESANNPYLCY